MLEQLKTTLTSPSYGLLRVHVDVGATSPNYSATPLLPKPRLFTCMSVMSPYQSPTPHRSHGSIEVKGPQMSQHLGVSQFSPQSKILKGPVSQPLSHIPYIIYSLSVRLPHPPVPLSLSCPNCPICPSLLFQVPSTTFPFCAVSLSLSSIFVSL